MSNEDVFKIVETHKPDGSVLIVKYTRAYYASKSAQPPSVPDRAPRSSWRIEVDRFVRTLSQGFFTRKAYEHLLLKGHKNVSMKMVGCYLAYHPNTRKLFQTTNNGSYWTWIDGVAHG